VRVSDRCRASALVPYSGESELAPHLGLSRACIGLFYLYYVSFDTGAYSDDQQARSLGLSLACICLFYLY